MQYLQAINDWLVGLMGPLGPILAVGFFGLLLILVTLPTFIMRQRDPLDRLKAIQAAENKAVKKGDRLRHEQGRDKLEKFSTFLEPKDEKELSAIRLKLLQAGYRTKNAVRIFHFMQFALGLLGLIIGVAYTMMSASVGEVSTQKLLLSVIVPGAAGYMFPKYWVTRRVETRKQNIINAFPDSLDMMLVCVEAGQSLDQAILRVSKELKTGGPDLADEFELVSHEMKAGKDKTAVLRDMGDRCGVADISSFVTVLIQSQQFGTSIAEALRVYAGEMRDKRVMRAEEKANTLPTKMTLATMMLTVPPLLIILIGPSIFEIYMTLGGGDEEGEAQEVVGQ